MKHERKISSGGALLSAASLVVLIAGLKAGGQILIPIVFAFFLSVLGAPIIAWLSKKKVPKIISVILVASTIILFFLFIISLFSNAFEDFTYKLPAYQSKLEKLGADVSETLTKYHVSAPGELLSNLASPGSIFDFFGSTVSSVISAISNIFLVIIFVIFMLFESANFAQKVNVAFEDKTLEKRLQGIQGDVQTYLAAKTFTSAVTGVAISIALTLLGIDFPILWGLVAFLLNFIPYIGSIIAGIPAVLLAIVQISPVTGLWVTLCYLAVNLSIGNILEPVLMGRHLGLSPLVVILSLVFWGWLWGPVGALMSVPLTMMLRIVLEHHEDSRWIAILLSAKRYQST